MKKSGGWIFLSHSHRDIEKVRIIRNDLESRGFEPLMFYLKCLSDEDEINELIKREISEREWFILIDSPNSRKSKWVKAERDYINTIPNKKKFVIDLNGSLKEQVDWVCRNLSIYLEYARYDSDLAFKIKNELEQREYLVFDEMTNFDSCNNVNLRDSFDDKIKFLLENRGYVIFILSEQSLVSKFVLSELLIVKKYDVDIVPVFVDGCSIDMVLRNPLITDEEKEIVSGISEIVGTIQGITISSSFNDEDKENMLNRLKYYSSNYYCPYFSSSCGFVSAETIVYPDIVTVEEYAFIDCERLKEVTFPKCVSYIPLNAFPDRKILIKCYKDSAAHRFAMENGFDFELINEE